MWGYNFCNDCVDWAGQAVCDCSCYGCDIRGDAQACARLRFEVAPQRPRPTIFPGVWEHDIASEAREEEEVESVRGRTRMLGHVPEAVEAGAHPKAAGANIPKGKAGGKGSPAAGGQ